MADVTQIGHWINGARVAGESGREGDVFNPATGQVTGRVALASPGELDTAVAAARAALPGWRDTGLTKRTAVMFKLREIITARSDELARIITSEHGKVVSDAAGDQAQDDFEAYLNQQSITTQQQVQPKARFDTADAIASGSVVASRRRFSARS